MPPASGSDLAALALRERGHALPSRSRVDVGKGLHSVPPRAVLRRAPSSTVSGVIGRLRMRTPVALATALAMAAAVEIVGGSPSPMTPRSG